MVGSEILQGQKKKKKPTIGNQDLKHKELGKGGYPKASRVLAARDLSI